MQNNKDISNLLLKKAVELNLCQPWQDAWQDEFPALMDMYKRGIDFCIENDYPSLDILRKHFKGKTEAYNIFIDADGEVNIHSGTVVVTGDSKLKINVADYGVMSLYVRHASEVNVCSGDHSVISVESYDQSALNVKNAYRINVYQYNDSTVTGEKVIIHKRNRDAK